MRNVMELNKIKVEASYVIADIEIKYRNNILASITYTVELFE